MTVKSAPFYWLECDAVGCDARSTDGCDYLAYSDIEGAIVAAEDEGTWKIVNPVVLREIGLRDEQTYHYCDEHAGNVCRDCEHFDPTRYAGERDYLCVACAAKQGIHQCPSCGYGDGMHDNTCTVAGVAS